MPGIATEFGVTRLVIVLIAVAAAFACETVVGFGATLFALAIAGFVLPVPELLSLVVPVNVLLSAYLAVRHARFVRWGYFLRAVVPPMLAGVPIGFSIYALRGSTGLQVAFGVFVTALACFELWGLRRLGGSCGDLSVERSFPVALRSAVLFVAGVVHGLFASGGPLVVYAAARDRLGKAEFRATLSALWLGVNLVMVVAYWLSGKLRQDAPEFWVASIPALVSGILVGERIHRHVDPRRFERAVFGLLALAGVGLAGIALRG